MKLGVCSGLFSDRPLPEALDIFQGMGIEGVEIYCGGREEDLRHSDAAAVLADRDAAKKYRSEFERRGMCISSLNCSGNPVHPDEARARIDRDGFERTVLAA